MKLSIVPIVLSLLFMTACSQQGTQTISIGAVMPLSGENAGIGLSIQQAMEVAVKDLNDAGGIDGKPLKIIFEDGQCSGKSAVTATQKLIATDKVHLILGGACSGESLAMIPVAEQNKVLLFSPASSSPVLTDSSKYFVRNYPSDASSSARTAWAAYTAGYRKVGLVSESTDYAQALRKVFIDTFEGLGGKIVADEKFDSSSADFRTQMTKVTTGTDAVMIIPQTPAKLGLLLKQVKAAGFKGQIYSSEMAGSPDVLTDFAAEDEGVVYATGVFDESAADVQALYGKLTTAYGKVPDALPGLYLAAAYDNVMIAAESIKACGQTDTDCMQKHIRAIRERPGLVGSLTMQEDGDPAFNYELRVIKDNKAVALE